MIEFKVPLDFNRPGVGYSNNSGPPVGGWNYNPVSNFFGEDLSKLLPSGRSFFGSKIKKRQSAKRSKKRSKRQTKKRSKRRSKKQIKRPKSVRMKVKKMRCFGSSKYPLLNLPNKTYDMQTFPLPPVGPGNTPGGDGGIWLQGMPSFNSYWG